MPGSLDLSTPNDLFDKLTHDLERLRNNSNDIYAAFDFFVTAECMLDWLYPGNTNRKKREKIRESDPILLVISHLASSLKHFDKLSDHHQSVKDAGGIGAFLEGGFFGGGFFGGKRLLIIFKGAAVDAFGSSMLAVDFAVMALDYWKTYFNDRVGT